MPRLLIIIFSCFFIFLYAFYADDIESEKMNTIDPLIFGDAPLKTSLNTPDWFKLSFLNLNDDLQDALKSGKKGLIIYFGLTNCPYCKAQLEVNWGSKDIVEYTKKHFDVLALDANGLRKIIDFNGNSMAEKDFSVQMKTNFTPSLLFYDRYGKLALRLSGYRPPYQFRASLEYVADGHYNKEPFHDYLARAEKAFGFGQAELNEHYSFAPPPYNLDRRTVAKKPLLVFYEHPKCHACDVMHGGPMSKDEITSQLTNFDVVQLDSTSDTQVITPSGKQTTALKWAKELDLNFAPTLIFFDEHGKEIFRIDSVIHLYRMQRVLSYILSKGYLKQPTLLLWQTEKNRQP